MKLVNEAMIKKWEGLRLEAYKPTANDVWTIGWGHTSGVHEGMSITKGQAQRFFEEDTQWAEDAVNRLVKVVLNQNQFDALVSFVFNIGETNFAKSTLLRKLNAKRYDEAADEFMRWKYQDGKVLKGLVRRRSHEMNYFLKEADDSPENVKPDSHAVVKSAMVSKEVVGGVSSILSAVGAALGGLVPGPQLVLSVAFSAVIIGVAGYFIWERMKEKSRGDK